ncbi:MAG: taurine transporter permease [Ramlibacter sp.]|jgi:NitT/TauT family transport system substrate-binding protein|nr:taurine transporter permease [Ramlibacter sp.]
MNKRVFVRAAAALAFAAAFAGPALAQTTPIKFQLDWRFEGPAALFLTPVSKGYFKDARLDVTVDVGSGPLHGEETDRAAAAARPRDHLHQGIHRRGA